MWTAAIIAGGQATRFGGRDKARLPIGGTSILERQLAALRGLVSHIIIIANDPGRFSETGIPVIGDLAAGSGALGGVYTAVSAAPDDRTLAVAGDMPFLDRGLLSRLIELGRLADVAVPHGRSGLQPLCATYSRACVPELRLRAETGRLRIMDFIREASGLRVMEIGADELARLGDESVMFFNVNTPQDYARAEEIAARAGKVEGRTENGS
jgi:molybdopterin-guanine dinucleotide biosynthesis protein A